MVFSILDLFHMVKTMMQKWQQLQQIHKTTCKPISYKSNTCRCIKINRSPIRTAASIRGVHYIPESVMRLSQNSEPHYEEIDSISDRLGPVPPLPIIYETSTAEAPKIIPYHATTIKDINRSTELEEPNQYLDLHA